MAYTRNWLEKQEDSVESVLDRTVNPALNDVNSVVGFAEGELGDVNAFLNRYNQTMPHFRHSAAGVNNWEPIFLNQFDVIISPPRAITGSGYYVDILTEQVKAVTGIPEMLPTGVIEQKYMWATRSYSKPTPETSVANLEISFEVNLNNRNSMYVYEMMREWAEVQFNPRLSLHGTKSDYGGEMTIIMYNKAHRLFRQFNFKGVFLYEPFNPMDLDYLSDSIYVMTVKFRSDMWNEVRNKIGNAVEKKKE
jgi:hypothetical protein